MNQDISVILERQLIALQNARYDIALRRDGGRVEERPDLFVSQVKEIGDWLVEQNRRHRTVFFRPHGGQGHSLLAGLRHSQVMQMRGDGFEPALLIEFAPDRYEAWLRHDRKLSPEICAAVTRYLAELTGAEPPPEHGAAYGHVAGFWAYGAEGAEAFSVQLVEATGVVYSMAETICGRFDRD